MPIADNAEFMERLWDEYVPGDLIYGIDNEITPISRKLYARLEQVVSASKTSEKAPLLGSGQDKPYQILLALEIIRGIQMKRNEAPEVANFVRWLTDPSNADSAKMREKMPGLHSDYDGQKNLSKWILRYKTVGEKRNIHFILDGLEQQAVITGQRMSGYHSTYGTGDDDDDKYENLDFGGPLSQATLDEVTRLRKANRRKDITGCELRYIYRCREDDRVMTRVRFWFGGTRLAHPPWEDDRWRGFWRYYVSNAAPAPTQAAGFFASLKGLLCCCCPCVQ